MSSVPFRIELFALSVYQYASDQGRMELRVKQVNFLIVFDVDQ